MVRGGEQFCPDSKDGDCTASDQKDLISADTAAVDVHLPNTLTNPEPSSEISDIPNLSTKMQEFTV